MQTDPVKKTLKIRYMSDLHLEFLEHPPATIESLGEDLVILAGDIHVGVNGIRWAKTAFAGRQVLYVLGNHEFYGNDWERLVDQARVAAHGSNVHLLERNHASHMGVTFLGCSLWTDFNLYGVTRSMQVMGAAGRRLSDYRVIKCGHRTLRPSDVLTRHRESLEWLEQKLAARRPTVVITHHSPTEATGHPEFRGDVLTAAYISQLDRLVQPPVIAWIHGHSHYSTQAIVNDIPVMANTRGYPGHEEDPNFRWDAFFEVPLPERPSLGEFELLALALSGARLPPPPVASQPTMYLQRWRAFRIGDCVHLRGHNADPYDWGPKISSPIVDYLPDKLSIRTRSGRVYKLLELPDTQTQEGEGLYKAWLEDNNVRDDMATDATSEVIAALQLEPTVPGLEERFASRRKRRDRLDMAARQARLRRYKKRLEQRKNDGDDL